MKKLLATIASAFRLLGKFLTATRTILGNLLFLLLIMLFFFTLFAEKKPPVVKNAALILSLAGDIVEEKQQDDPFSTFLSEISSTPQPPDTTLLQDILDAINHATDDPQITCILLDLKDLGSVGLDQMQTIGAALNQFKKSGKKVIAAEDFYKQKGYYLASYASEIYLNPMGGVDLHGFGAYNLFFREALEKLHINYNVFRVGTYKSAVEPILRDSMSIESKEQTRGLINSLWGIFTADITRQRALPADAINQYTSQIAEKMATAAGSTARLAVNEKLVDGLKTRGELCEYMGKLTDSDTDGDFQRVKLGDYLRSFTPSYQPPSLPAENVVGIIIAEGMILDGEQPVGTIGGDTLAEVIRKARLDQTVKAVVLRVNSGGGSAFASEIIRQELLELKKAGKPLVVSMGSTAASGGYWIAADADEIWASAATITGSIGIFAAIPTFENSLANLGIHSDGIGTTPLASGLDLTRPLAPPLKQSIQMSLDSSYRQFLDLVAQGRKTKVEKVENVAEGRVFHGEEAQRNGLVDKIGTLEEAIASAASLAKLKEYTAQHIEKPRTLREEVMAMISGKIATTLLAFNLSQPVARQIAGLLQPVRELLLYNDPAGLYAQSLVKGPALLGR